MSHAPTPGPPDPSAPGQPMRTALCVRSQVLKAIRDFFHARSFVEVETPVRVITPCTELHIDAEPSGDHYLRTSPELHMKRLLADGFRQIFQIGPCFRRGERGDLHNPEYTMLEWYRVNADYRDILADTRALLLEVTKAASGSLLTRNGASIDLAPDWPVITITEAFEKHAGWNPVEDFDADRFNADLVDLIEPALPRDVPVVLTDFPAELAALARLKPDNPAIAERWELYIGGLELANAYSELTDAVEQQARFEKWTGQRQNDGRATYPPDHTFMEALRQGLPTCGGIALGVDRLVMLCTGATSLDEVLPFRE